MKKIVNIFIIFILILLLSTSFVMASDLVSSMKDWNKVKDAELAYEFAGQVLNIVQIIGNATSIIMLSVIGIKYFISSTNEKATIKEKLFPFLIGAILIFGASNLLKWIGNIAITLNT